MSHRVLVALAVAALLVFSGCLESNVVYTLNPNGAGKAEVDLTLPSGGPIPIGNEAEAPKERARQQVRQILTESPGVVAWKGVEYELTDEGDLHVTGTAYFRKLSEVQFTGNMRVSMLSPSWRKTDDGSGKLTMQQEEGRVPGAAKMPDDLDEKQIEMRMKQARKQFKRMKPAMEGFMSDMKIVSTFRLPAPIANSTNFEKLGARKARVVFAGQKMAEAMDKLMSDDAWLRRVAEHGGGLQNRRMPPPARERLNKLVYGEAGPVRLTTEPELKPRFDFEAEVKAARQAREKMYKRLGLTPPTPVATLEGEGFVDLRVAGVQRVFIVDREAGIRPFHFFKEKPGVELALLGTLPGAALSAGEGKITKAVDSTGRNMLPEKGHERSVDDVELTDSKRKMLFNVQLNAPAPEARGVREVSGHVSYFVAEGEKKVRLGEMKLKAGQTSDQLGAKITEIGERDWGPQGKMLKLRLEVEPRAVKRVRFLDDDGAPLEVDQNHTVRRSGRVTLGFTREGGFPEAAKIVVTLHDQMKKYRVPFSLKNTGFDGQPMVR